MLHQPVNTTPEAWLAANDPAGPVNFFAPAALAERLAAFQRGFPGLVTYAVKANPAEAVLRALHAGGVTAFDVASADEIALIRRLCPGAVLHYNNPVRSRREIAFGILQRVESWSIDAEGELDKLMAAGVPQGNEIAVRFRLGLQGGTYNFGAKFGAEPDEAAMLLARVAAAGFRPALTFHVGTQCTDPSAYQAYVEAAAAIAAKARVRIDRLNVGGGFPAGRNGRPVNLLPFFAAISRGLAAFPVAPALVCEPGRGLVADAFAYAVRVKSLRAERVYLEDGIYGGLSEFPSMPMPAFRVLGPQGARQGAALPRIVFGPTCDSLDRLPGEVPLPADLAEEDWILWPSMGAYLTGVTTRFNGYGTWDEVVVDRLA